MLPRAVPTGFPPFVLAAAALLGACTPHEDADLTVAVVADAPAAPGHAASSRLAGQLLAGATAEGLVALDEEGRVIPALADRWIVTDDGQSYIFRLRTGTWPDGSPITGESIRAALDAALAAQRGTALGLDLDGVEEVRAMAGRVVELRLSHGMPDLLQLLAQPELGLLRRDRGTGPLLAKRARGGTLLTAIAPEKRGLPPVEGWQGLTHSVRLEVLPGDQALARYAEGSITAVIGGTFADAQRVTRTALGRSTARPDPVIGLFGLAVQGTDGVLSAPEFREALAMAIDRDALAASLEVGGWQPTTRMIGRGVADDSGLVDERWQNRSLADRQASAAGRLTRWTGGGKHPVLRVALPAGPGADILAARLAADFGAIGLGFVRVAIGAPADLRLIDQVARYPRSQWFLNQLSCVALRGPCSAEADALARKARAEADPAKAADVVAEAEAKLTQANIFLPLGPPVRWSLWSGSDLGLAANRWGYHPLAPLAIRPDTR
ncbi:MAG: ABC transporter substrate-binding protein [Proteobacteria bacterium]|nr:ABC transporter substrate-binding protein [Pseudomonadota bacterium]